MLGLLDTADANHAPYVIVNVENELETVLSPARLAAIFESDPYPGDIGISTVGWVYNAVDFASLADYPALLQLFPTDMRIDPAMLETVQGDCVRHARQKSFRHVGVTIQTYGGAEPSWYAYQRHPRSYFTGDDIAALGWDDWKPS